jgi:hypothetical protein
MRLSYTRGTEELPRLSGLLPFTVLRSRGTASRSRCLLFVKDLFLVTYHSDWVIDLPLVLFFGHLVHRILPRFSHFSTRAVNLLWDNTRLQFLPILRRCLAQNVIVSPRCPGLVPGKLASSKGLHYWWCRQGGIPKIVKTNYCIAYFWYLQRTRSFSFIAWRPPPLSHPHMYFQVATYLAKMGNAHHPKT